MLLWTVKLLSLNFLLCFLFTLLSCHTYKGWALLRVSWGPCTILLVQHHSSSTPPLLALLMPGSGWCSWVGSWEPGTRGINKARSQTWALSFRKAGKKQTNKTHHKIKANHKLFSKQMTPAHMFLLRGKGVSDSCHGWFILLLLITGVSSAPEINVVLKWAV